MRWCGPRPRFELGPNSCWPSQRPQLPRTLPLHFLPCCPLNDCRMAAHSFLEIGCLSSLFFYLFHARLRLVILFLLLMSSSVYPNPGPIFPCSVCAGNVTWRGRSVQCCTCSKWTHLWCSLLSLLQIQNSWQISLQELPAPAAFLFETL